MRCAKRSALVGALTAVAGALATAAPAAAIEPDPAFDWYGLGGCTVPVIGMPTDFANVAPFIPDSEEPKVLNVGADGVRQAGLIFVLIGCPENTLDTDRGNYSRADVTQVMAGVLYESGRAEDLEKAQFYLLSSAIDWQPFVASEGFLEIPGDYVPSMSLEVFRDSVSGLGTFASSVPGGSAPFSTTGQILAPNDRRDLPQDAVHFYRGALGLVRVHHDESWAAGNEALGTVTAPAGSAVATWMGATARQAEGVYVWINDVLHVHRYRVVAN